MNHGHTETQKNGKTCSSESVYYTETIMDPECFVTGMLFAFTYSPVVSCIKLKSG